MCKLFYRLIFAAVILLAAGMAHAQVCTGNLGAPVVNETFGAGTNNVGPALPASVTTYQYFPADACGAEDGQYAISNSMRSPSCKAGTWQTIAHDHTGDAGGYFMVINSSVDPGIFYTQHIAGNTLCPNTTYQFAAWIMNILRDLPQTQGFSKPNITFSIEKTDGTILKTFNTGDINTTISPTFYQYGTFFTSPADGSDVVVKMTNNGRGGNGNDLAMDDITVSPCGPVIQVGFNSIADTTTRRLCAGDNFSYTITGQQAGYSNPSYQWQQKYNSVSGWADISGATSQTITVTSTNSKAGTYQYRLGVLNGAQTGSESCRIYSDSLKVHVFPYPVVTTAATTIICAGQPLQLSSMGTGTGTYVWSGPNGYTATGDSPATIDNATSAYNGTYTVKFTVSGCASFASTVVSVVQPASVQPMADQTICAGTSLQLNAVAANTTHYLWSPSAGLDHDNIANPIATPATTTTYTVEVYNDGCNDVMPSAQTVITVLKNPTADAGAGLKLFEGSTGKLTGTSGGDNITKAFWTPSQYLDDPNSLTPVTSAVKDITYTLHVLSSTCGEATSNVFVRVYNKLNVFNTFTPNGDGVNDFWNITNLTTYPNAVINVYDRQGQKVYTSKGYSTPWDGMYAGAKLPTGTYYYIIDFKEDNLPRVSGWVFIVR